MNPVDNDCGGDDHKILMVIITCIVEIEDLVAKIYRIISKHFPPHLAGLLLHIARESENHHQTLKHLKEILQCEEPVHAKCSHTGVEVLRGKLRELEESDRVSELSRKDLLELFNILVEVEEFASEEYYVMMIIPLLVERLGEAGIPPQYIEVWRWALEEISEEEKYHAKIAESLKAYLEVFK